jgi:hypothetical protein
VGKDDYYAQVNQVTEAAMERLAILTPGISEFILANYGAIREAGERHLPPEERNHLINLSFFYFLATCIDFLFFLHLRHRHVNIYDHELEHIVSVMITHARHQRQELRAAADAAASATALGMPESTALDWAEFERELRRVTDEFASRGGSGPAHG